MILSLKGKLCGLCLVAVISNAIAQYNVLGQYMTGNVNTVNTAVPFLLISPDARANGMGEAGVASEPDANSIFWNPAKQVFAKDSAGLSLSYCPWMRQYTPGRDLVNLSFFFKINDKQAVSAYFTDFTYNNFKSIGGPGGFNPNECAVGINYSRKLGNNWSLGLSAKYIYSDLYPSYLPGILAPPISQSVGVDLSAYHRKDIVVLGKSAMLSEGICISNIGPKMPYGSYYSNEFLPINLRIGGAFTFNFNQYNKVTITEDANKLLVPTPPYYALNIYGRDSIGTNGQPVIEAGMNPNVNVLQGMLQSFYDAPGGALEEWQEITWSTGIEYSYNEQFFARTGFFYENPTKGGREFYTAGIGFKLAFVKIDAAYLISIIQQNPLQNTVFISLSFSPPW